MFKSAALIAVASAAAVMKTAATAGPVPAAPHVNSTLTNNAINKAVNIAEHHAETAEHIEQRAARKSFKALNKYAKLAVLQGQYADYKFMKHVFWRLQQTLHYLGPQKGCRAATFARCVAQQSANKTRFDDDEFNFEKATQRYPQCTAKSGCAFTITKLTPAQKTALQAKARRSDNYLRGLYRNNTRTQERLAHNLERQINGIKRTTESQHKSNAMNATNKILSTFKCNNACFLQKAQQTRNLEFAWRQCGCQAPVELKFSPEEVMQMMSEHNMDVNAGMDEEEINFAAEPATDAGASWGWMAFGTLATANAAYFAVKKN